MSDTADILCDPRAHNGNVITPLPRASAHHVCQLWRSEERFLDSLAAYVGTGLRQGEAVLVIATAPHLAALQQRLRRIGHDVGGAFASQRLVAADAAQTLALFLVNGWPDTARFEAAVDRLLARAARKARGVRAFGEMVGLLTEQGRYAAALELERLWNRYLTARDFPLFCAYSHAVLSGAGETAAAPLVAEHARQLAA
jgi:hypothetical protein